MDINTYLEDAPRGAGAALAKALGVHPVMVSQWSNGVKPVPLERCAAIERATEGRVTCEELRGDVRWHRLPDATWPHAGGRPCIDVAAPAPTLEPAAAVGA